MTPRQRIRFFQQMAVLIRAGVPLRASLTRLKEKNLGASVSALADKVNMGEPLGDAFAAAGFEPFESHLVAAGENSAHLHTIFDHLAGFWTRELEMRRALVKPLVYPAVVMHLAIFLGSGLQLVSQPPLQVVVHLILTLAFLYAACFVIYMLVRASWSHPAMRGFWLRVPLIGRAFRTTYAYRWITALRLEFTAGVTISRAVGDAWRASNHVGGEAIAQEAENALRSGTPLSALMRQWTQLPRDWIDFVETGEISGQYEEMFTNIQAEAGREWESAQQNMTTWVPRIVYFVALIIVAIQVGSIMYQVEIAPIENIQQQIDNATR